MEYLKVIVPGRDGQDIDVLLNKERNGKVGQVLVLGKGMVLVSIDLPNAEEKQVDLCDTTTTHPLIVEIKA